MFQIYLFIDKPGSTSLIQSGTCRWLPHRCAVGEGSGQSQHPNLLYPVPELTPKYHFVTQMQIQEMFLLRKQVVEDPNAVKLYTDAKRRKTIYRRATQEVPVPKKKRISSAEKKRMIERKCTLKERAYVTPQKSKKCTETSEVLSLKRQLSKSKGGESCKKKS